MTSVLTRSWHRYRTYLAGFTAFHLSQVKPDRVKASDFHAYGSFQQVVAAGDRDYQDYILVSAVK